MSRERNRNPLRVDAPAKADGTAPFVDDLVIDGVWHGVTLRSDVPRGSLRAIERDPAFDWNEVVIVTADDVPGRNEIRHLVGDQPALVPVGGEVRHAEEPLALIAAPTRDLALAAKRHLRAKVEPLDPVLTIDDSLARGKDDDVFKRIEIRAGDEDLDAVLAGCAHVVEGEYTTPTQEQMYIEPQGIVAAFDDDGECRIQGSLQCPFYVRTALEHLLALPPERVVVTQTTTGGAFGGKEDYPSMLAAHAALLARKARRPVKIVYDRAEDIAATPKRHPSRTRHRLGLDAEGNIVAIDVDLVLDAGAYVTLSPVVLSRAVLHAAGAYRIPHLRILGRAVATNHPPYGAFRGFGAPQALFAMERQVQKGARRLGIDAIALRRKNMLRRGDRTSTGGELTYSVATDQVLDAVESRLQDPSPPRPVDPLPSARAADPARIRRGRGIAFGLHGAGFTGSGETYLASQVEVARTAAGDFEVRVGSTDMGQGSKTTLSQIAARALGVEDDQVSVPAPSTDAVPNSGPTVASRTCMVVGGLVERAARELRDRLDEAGPIAVTTTYESPAEVRFDDETYTGTAYPCYGWNACAVDVAVDLDTYEVTVERCVHAVDVGRAINPAIVEGQIEGGTLQGLGWALWEDVVVEGGHVRNPRLSTNVIPTGVEAPEIETLIIEEPYPHGPDGAKGVGEIPLGLPAVAAAGAIEDALDVAFDALPVNPERICATLEEDA